MNRVCFWTVQKRGIDFFSRVPSRSRDKLLGRRKIQSLTLGEKLIIIPGEQQPSSV